jgi:hypothetical protein
VTVLRLLDRVAAAGYCHGDAHYGNMALRFEPRGAVLCLLDFGQSSVAGALPILDLLQFLRSLSPKRFRYVPEPGRPEPDPSADPVAAAGHWSLEHAEWKQARRNQAAAVRVLRRSLWNAFTHRFPETVSRAFRKSGTLTIWQADLELLWSKISHLYLRAPPGTPFPAFA